MLALGEVRTALLQNSVSVLREVARQILRLRPGEQVRSSERPIDYAVSPDVLTGVDCRLATPRGNKNRGIGTVATHASVTGCRILQGSTYAEIILGRTDSRARWSHYLARPAVVEVAGGVQWAEIRDGFLTQEAPDTLNLGAISARTMNAIQLRPELDRAPPFRAQRTALRWTLQDPAEGAPTGETAHFTISSPTLRTLRLSVPRQEVHAVVQLCEDLALHDWLLSTLLELIERGQRVVGQPAQIVEYLRPAVELMHLWLPGARIDESLREVWAGFERRPGFSRQWEVSVNRIRDQIAVTMATRLSGAALPS